jgi:hypothetical protein
MSLDIKETARVLSQNIDRENRKIRTVISKGGSFRMGVLGCAGAQYPDREGIVHNEPQHRVALGLKQLSPDLSIVIIDGDMIYPDGVDIIRVKELLEKLKNPRLSEDKRDEYKNGIQARINVIAQYFLNVYGDTKLPFRLNLGNHESSAHISGRPLLAAWQWLKHNVFKVSLDQYIEKAQAFIDAVHDFYSEEVHEALATDDYGDDAYRKQALLPVKSATCKTGLEEGSDNEQFVIPARYYHELVYQEGADENDPFAVIVYIDSTTFASDQEQIAWLTKLNEDINELYPNIKHKVLTSHHTVGFSDDKRSLKSKEPVYPLEYHGNLHRNLGIALSVDAGLELDSWSVLAAHTHDLSITDSTRIRYDELKKALPKMQAAIGIGGAMSSKNKQKMSAFTQYTRSGFGLGVYELSEESATLEIYDCEHLPLVCEYPRADANYAELLRDNPPKCVGKLHYELDGSRIKTDNQEKLPEHQKDQPEETTPPSQHFHPGFVNHQREWFDTMFSILQSGQIPLLKWFLIASDEVVKDIDKGWIGDHVLDEFADASLFNKDAMPDQKTLEDYVLKIEKIMYEYFRYDKGRHLTKGFNQIAALRTCLDQVLKHVEQGSDYTQAVIEAHDEIYEHVDQPMPNYGKDIVDRVMGLTEEEKEELIEEEDVDGSPKKTYKAFKKYVGSYFYPPEPPKPDDRLYAKDRDQLARLINKLKVKFIREHNLQNEMPEKLFNLADQIKKGNVKSIALGQLLMLELLIRTSPDPMIALSAFVQSADAELVKLVLEHVVGNTTHKQYFEQHVKLSEEKTIKRPIIKEDYEVNFNEAVISKFPNDKKHLYARRSYIRGTLKNMDAAAYSRFFTHKGMASLYASNGIMDQTLKVTLSTNDHLLIKLKAITDEIFSSKASDKTLTTFHKTLRDSGCKEALIAAEPYSGETAKATRRFFRAMPHEQEEYSRLKASVLSHMMMTQRGQSLFSSSFKGGVEEGNGSLYEPLLAHPAEASLSEM